MDNEELQKAFDSDMSDKKRSLRVHLINPPLENPWRTRKEYIEERDKQLELQQKQIEALKALKKSSWQQTIVFVVTIVVSVASIIGTWVSVLSYLKPE